MKELQVIQEVSVENYSERRMESYRQAQMASGSQALESFSMSDAEAPEQTLANKKQETQTNALSKQPAEAPAIKKQHVEELKANELNCINESTAKLGLRRAVDQKLSMASDVHDKLGRSMPIDTLLPNTFG